MTAQIIMPAAVQRRRKVRQRWGFYAIAALAALVCLTALFSEWIAPYDPNAQIFASLSPPSWEHWAGTDRYGRDLFSRILVGLRTSIFATLSLVFIIMTTGTIVGMICGYRGGYVDTIMMRISDVCLAFPGLVFALAIAALLNGGLVNAVFALAAISWPKYARIARSQTLRLKDSDFLAAAKMSGATTAAQIWRHILPNILSPIIVQMTFTFATAIISEASLSFLGAGIPSPYPSWGGMLNEARGYVYMGWWMIVFPAIFTALSVLGFNLFGDGLRDLIDPLSGR